MGNNPPKHLKPPQITTDNQLNFYTQVLDPNLGPSKIYTSKKFHLCYILKHDTPNQDTKIYNTFKHIEQSQSDNLLTMYGFSVERRSCCSRVVGESLCSYWEYYNFYFKEYLLKRRQQNLMFIDSEVWHVVEVCCESYDVFRRNGVYYEINPETFVVTPEGKMKAFWCHLKSQNKHMKFFQYFDSNYKVSRFPYAPEELQYMHQQDKTTKLDFDRCNSYRLGMLLLQCLSLTQPLSSCYNPSMTSINFSVVRNLILTKVSQVYPNDITTLLRFLLRQDPRKRPTLSQVYQQYQGKFSLDFQLRVCGIKSTDSIHVNQNQLQTLNQSNMRKGFDYSNDKTIKRHSFKKI